MIKQCKGTYENIAKKEVEIEDIANEISRVQIDNLNTQTQNEILKKKLKDLVKELEESSEDLKQSEEKIRKKHLEIQKRQHQVDKLNRELAEIKKNKGEDESTGPDEAKKNNLSKQINEKDDEILQIQKEWITNQTALIEQQNKY